jgi:hypothetical protein
MMQFIIAAFRFLVYSFMKDVAAELSTGHQATDMKDA